MAEIGLVPLGVVPGKPVLDDADSEKAIPEAEKGQRAIPRLMFGILVN